MNTIACVSLLSAFTFVGGILAFAYKAGNNNAKAKEVDIVNSNNKIVNNMNQQSINGTNEDSLKNSLQEGTF